eukprot:4304268-Pyramimonas_sp.AAC.1
MLLLFCLITPRALFVFHFGRPGLRSKVSGAQAAQRSDSSGGHFYYPSRFRSSCVKTAKGIHPVVHLGDASPPSPFLGF